MPRFSRWTLALLALVALGVSPVLAVAPGMPGDVEDPASAPAPPDVLSLEAQLEEPPAETPVPSPEDVSPEDLERRVDPGQELFFEAIRVCDWSEEQQCPSGCHCLIIRDAVNCFC